MGLAFSGAMTASPAKVSEKIFRSLSAHLLKEQMVEFTASIALEISAPCSTGPPPSRRLSRQVRAANLVTGDFP